MTELLAAGGCWNSIRFAIDGEGVNLRDWEGAIETNQTFHNQEVVIIAVNFDGDDMNVATDATFKLQYKNDSDAGSWIDVAASGNEINWATSTDLVDAAGVAAAALRPGPSCSSQPGLRASHDPPG